jgi:uncharacterized protein (TIGR02300 family)
MARDLGTKYNCFKCGTKFYDLKKPVPTCPKCGADQRDMPVVKPLSAAKQRAAAAAAAPKEAEETDVPIPEEGAEEEEDDDAEEEVEAE